MELCIKTVCNFTFSCIGICFNPCFNGTMYKNFVIIIAISDYFIVSILVLMELCIKTKTAGIVRYCLHCVSILVLMELCIKTVLFDEYQTQINMVSILVLMELCIKTVQHSILMFLIGMVSILVLMELCIKTEFDIKHTLQKS